MTDRHLRIAIGAMVVVLLIVLVATAMVMGSRGTATASPSPGASASGSSSPSGSAGGSAETSGEPPASAEASPSPSASPTPPAVPLAILTVVNIKLDATSDSAGNDRIVTFKSEGPGTILVNLSSASGQGTTHICLLRGKTQVGCQDLGSGTFTGQTSRDSANWHVTLRGLGDATPTVKVKITFQSNAPSVKIAHARFDGTGSPDTNGIEVRFKVRSSGKAQLDATWADDFTYDIDVIDQAGDGDVTLTDEGPASGVTQSWPVEPGVWRIILSNSEPGTGDATDLTATVSWP